MQIDFSGQQASSPRHSRRKRAAHATLAAMLAGAVSLIFSFAMGLQDAGWTEAWSFFSGPGLDASAATSSPTRRLRHD